MVCKSDKQRGKSPEAVSGFVQTAGDWRCYEYLSSKCLMTLFVVFMFQWQLKDFYQTHVVKSRTNVKNENPQMLSFCNFVLLLQFVFWCLPWINSCEHVKCALKGPISSKILICIFYSWYKVFSSKTHPKCFFIHSYLSNLAQPFFSLSARNLFPFLLSLLPLTKLNT